MKNKIQYFEAVQQQLKSEIRTEILNFLSKQEYEKLDFEKNKIKILYGDDNGEFYYGILTSIFRVKDCLVIELTFDSEANDYLHIYEIDHADYFQAANLLEYYRLIIKETTNNKRTPNKQKLHELAESGEWRERAINLLSTHTDAHEGDIDAFVTAYWQNLNSDEQNIQDFCQYLREKAYEIIDEPMSGNLKKQARISDMELVLSKFKEEIFNKMMRLLQTCENKTVAWKQGKNEYISNVFMYFSTELGETYEGEVRKVWLDESGRVNFSLYDAECKAQLCETDCDYAMQSHKWLLDTLKAICEVLQIDHETL